eukprot:355488-Chlamydomonas_euryale.AAC.1
MVICRSFVIVDPNTTTNDPSNHFRGSPWRTCDTLPNLQALTTALATHTPLSTPRNPHPRRLTITGSGFSSDAYTGGNAVFVGPYPCSVIDHLSTPYRIVCETSRGDDGAYNVTVAVDGRSAASACCFNYDRSGGTPSEAAGGQGGQATGVAGMAADKSTTGGRGGRPGEAPMARPTPGSIALPGYQSPHQIVVTFSCAVASTLAFPSTTPTPSAAKSKPLQENTIY